VLFLVFVIQEVVEELLHEFDCFTGTVFCFFAGYVHWRVIQGVDRQFAEFERLFVENQVLRQFHELALDVVLDLIFFNEVGEHVEELLDRVELFNRLVVAVVAERADQLDAGLELLEVRALHDLAAALDDQLALAAHSDVVHADEELLERVLGLDEQVDDLVLLALDRLALAHAQRGQQRHVLLLVLHVDERLDDLLADLLVEQFLVGADEGREGVLRVDGVALVAQQRLLDEQLDPLRGLELVPRLVVEHVFDDGLGHLLDLHQDRLLANVFVVQLPLDFLRLVHDVHQDVDHPQVPRDLLQDDGPFEQVSFELPLVVALDPVLNVLHLREHHFDFVIPVAEQFCLGRFDVVDEVVDNADGRVDLLDSVDEPGVDVLDQERVFVLVLVGEQDGALVQADGLVLDAVEQVQVLGALVDQLQHLVARLDDLAVAHAQEDFVAHRARGLHFEELDFDLVFRLDGSEHFLRGRVELEHGVVVEFLQVVVLLVFVFLEYLRQA